MVSWMWAIGKEGLRPFKVKEPKVGEDHSEVLREGADDLTLRAEEVDTLKACINVDHIEKFWGPSFVDADWHLFAKQFIKEMKEVRCEELYNHHSSRSPKTE